jgi:hypothetical protein
VTKTEVTGETSGTYTRENDDGTSEEVPWSRPILSTTTYNDGYSIETGKVDVIALSGDGTTP